MKYISVAIENSALGMDRLYTYACKYDDVKPGDGVIIPFGAGNGRRRGFVFEVKDETEYDAERIKDIISVEKGLLSQEAVFLCVFLKERYLCRYIDAVKCFIPSGYFTFENILSIADIDAAEGFINNPKSPARQVKLVSVLLETGPLKKSVLKNAYGIGYDVMAAVTKKGLTVQGKIERRRRPHEGIKPDPESFSRFTEEQERAFCHIEDSLNKEEHKVFLIHGVTGSGKTRLYMESIRKALELGKTAIVIVPEISLTVQAIEKYRGEFGADNIAVIHSRLSEGEKYDEWMRIKRGEVKIVIGARSALFSPLENIGVIVVDEEHESSYKADNSPKYDARELAEKRAEFNEAVLILGSATPSIKSYYRSQVGDIERLTLRHRYNKTPLPDISVVDMREELIKGNKSIFSIKLYDEITRCLDEGKQIILFLNRRGYSSFVSCRKCGYVVKCKECGLPMTYHKTENGVVCHYCGRKEDVPVVCPECSGKYIKDFGIGTEKVEEIASKMFPEARISRLDLDTVRKKGSAEQIIGELKSGKTDILIGTQLVAKGHDFEGIGLVGIMAADISLNISDYRASENTFQLITQAAGRSGRGEEIGKVVVQTYSPEHYSVVAAANHDYESYYEEELMMRRMLSYPPFGELIQVVFLDEDEEKALACGEEFCADLRERAGAGVNDGIIGPTPTNISKIRGRYRYRVLIKYKDKDVAEFMKMLDDMRTEFSYEKYKSTLIGIDIDPYSLV